MEERLNWRGYFTARGAKAGLVELDLLAVRRGGDGGPEALHVEVQASSDPISWVTPWTIRLREEVGLASCNARMRTPEELPAIAAHGVEVVGLPHVLDELLDPDDKGRLLRTTSATAADIAALIGVDRRSRPPR